MAFQVDTKTIVLVASFVNLFIIILLQGYRGRVKRERSVNMFLNAKIFQMSFFIAWGISLFFQTPGWMQAVLPLIRSALFLTAIVCECLAYLMLLQECSAGLKSAYIGLLIIFIAAFWLVYFLEASKDFHIITFSMMAATIILYTVILCFIRKRNTILLRLVGILYLLIMGTFIFKALAAGNMFGSEAAVKLQWQTWLSFSLMVLMILCNNGFFMLAKEQTDDKLHTLANIDGLTGILNRRAFMEQAGKPIRYFARKKMPVSFMLIDVDGIQKVNDTYGHFMGDIALRTVAREIQNQLRAYDYLGRFCGDEFSVILPGTCEKDSGVVAERLRNRIESSVIHDERIKFQITISIGLVTVIPQSTTTIEMLYRLGKYALHEAKQAGGNRMIRAGGINEKGGADEKSS